MKTLPPVVDENGDINLHGRQGAVITVDFLDDAGAARSMTGRSVVFECGPLLNKTLTAGSSSNQMVLTLSRADVKTINDSPHRQFALFDESAAVPTPMWIGTVYITGWVE